LVAADRLPSKRALAERLAAHASFQPATGLVGHSQYCDDSASRSSASIALRSAHTGSGASSQAYSSIRIVLSVAISMEDLVSSTAACVGRR
jgi:hypothetical protein